MLMKLTLDGRGFSTGELQSTFGSQELSFQNLCYSCMFILYGSQNCSLNLFYGSPITKTLRTTALHEIWIQKTFTFSDFLKFDLSVLSQIVCFKQIPTKQTKPNILALETFFVVNSEN